GQIIALSDNTGFSSGPHLHHEFRENEAANSAFDPYTENSWLINPQTGLPWLVNPYTPTKPGGDHPDDNYDVSSDIVPGSFDAMPVYPNIFDVMILQNGFFYECGSLFFDIKNKKESYIPVDINVSINKLLEHPVLIIPSAGLWGVDNLPSMKDKLDEYVYRGGVLIVFSQQHGYEYSALPAGDKISAYGWLEDQGCFSNALYIDNWHQVLSGQSSATISASVDGYFTSYPDSTTVLLRRTKNNEPAMIMYPYGQGMVIATTMYEDWAYGNGQSTEQGRALIRDIISWAKKPEVLPEIRPGGPINLSFEAKNKTTDKEASQIKINILDPDRNIVSESIQSTSLSSGQSISLPISYFSLSTSPLGIWHVEYSLLDSAGVAFQTESQGARFVISNPSQGAQPNPDFMVWVTSTTENVTPGSTVVLTIHVKNNSDTDLINGSIVIGTWQTSVNVGAHSETSFIYTTSIGSSILFRITLLDSENIRLSSSEKGIWVLSASARADISLDKSTYKKGETVIINQTITNRTQAAYDCSVNTYILNPQNQKVYDTTESLNLSASGQVTHQHVYALTQELLFGTYIVCTDIYQNGTKIGGNSVFFNIPGALISFTPAFPAVWNTGNNSVSFTISNIGGADIQNGELKLELKDPNKTIVFSQTKPFTNLAQGANQVISFDVPISSILFGNYTLQYSSNYDNKFDAGIEIIPCQAIIKPSFDKISYNVLDDINLNIELIGGYKS
ncbi:MAG: hypothetical protein AB1414_16205, partial [bacterium]